MTTTACHGRAKCDQTYLSIRQLLLTEQDANARLTARAEAAEAALEAMREEPTEELVGQVMSLLVRKAEGNRTLEHYRNLLFSQRLELVRQVLSAARGK